MSDGVTIPVTGSGDATPKIATDDAGAAGHVQVVKLAVSADASAVALPGDAANGLDVDVTRLPAVSGTVAVSSIPSVAGTVSIAGTALADITAGHALKFAAFSGTAAGGTITCVAGTTAKQLTVVNYAVIAGAAMNLTWQSGASVIGGPLPVGANGGAAPTGSISSPLLQTAAGSALGLVQSAAGTVGGHLAYFEL